MTQRKVWLAAAVSGVVVLFVFYKICLPDVFNIKRSTAPTPYRYRWGQLY